MRSGPDTLARRVEEWFVNALIPCGADFAELGAHGTFEALGVDVGELLRALERDLGVVLIGTELRRTLTVGQAIERVVALAD